MNNSPKNSRPHPRYQMIRELGSERTGFSITYLAKDNSTQKAVVIKRFLLGQVDSNSSGFLSYKNEIEVFQKLNHPCIPRYLDAFETPDGFCLVQEYKNAPSLSKSRSFNPDEIKQIAVSILKILVYLQNQTPSVIHGNIKPENILVDSQLNVYLINFGFARTVPGKNAVRRAAPKHSSFTSPEQLRNRPLSKATDLYGLGATLICLLTSTPSTELDTLIDREGRFNFKNFLPNKVSLHLGDYLETMVTSNPKHRYPNAEIALEALKPINVNRLPEVTITPTSPVFKATELGEILTQTIKVNNPIPNTLLQGHWEVVPHPNESRSFSKTHNWIILKPSKFKGNSAVCQVTVDTRQLMASKTYKRQILLHTNSAGKTRSLTIKVQTAAIKKPNLLYVSLIALFAIASVGGWLGTVMMVGDTKTVDWAVLILGLVIGGVSGAAAAYSAINLFVKTVSLIVTVSAVIGFLPGFGSDVEILVGFVVGLVVAAVTGMVIKHHTEKRFPFQSAAMISVLTAALGMSSGMDFTLGFHNSFVMFALVGAGLPLATTIIAPFLQYARLIYQYRKSEPNLIKP